MRTFTLRSAAYAAVLAIVVDACSSGGSAVPFASGTAGAPVTSAAPVASSTPSVAPAASPSATPLVVPTVSPASQPTSTPVPNRTVTPMPATPAMPAPAAGFGTVSLGTFYWSPAAGEWMLSPPSPLTTSKTLVVVHGLFGNVQSDFACAGNLENAGGYEQAIGYGYDWSQTPVSQAAGLAAIVNGLPAGTPVDIEARSLGTLVTLAALPTIARTLHHVVFLGGPLPPTGSPQSSPSSLTYPAFELLLQTLSPAYAGAIERNVLPYMAPGGGTALAQAATHAEAGVPFDLVAGIGLIDVDGYAETPPIDAGIFLGQANDGLILQSAALDGTYLPNGTQKRTFDNPNDVDNHLGLSCSDAQIWSYVGASVQQ